MNRIPVALLGILSLTLAGCATSGAPQVRPQQMVENRDIRNQAKVVEGTMPGSPREVWRALRAVYDDLELEVTASDPVNRVLAARQNRMRRLGGQPNSRWVDCGQDVNGWVADRSFITFDLVSWLTAGSENTTELQVQFEARGMRRDGGSGQLICSSEGDLELEIQNRVKAKLAQ